MSNWFIILLLVSAAWQIIGSIAEKQAKKKQQEELARKRMEASARQRAGGGPDATGPAGETRVGVPSGARPGATDARSRAEEIAARRKAQIEELRRRAAERARPGGRAADAGADRGAAGRSPARMADASRTSRSRTHAPPGRPESTPAGGGTSARASSSRSAPPTQRSGMALDWEQMSRQRDQKRAQGREQFEQNTAREEAESRRRRSATDARRAKEKADAIARRDARLAVRAASGTRIGGAASLRGTRLREIARNRESLRDLIALKEILDPPVSMRDSSGVPADGRLGG